MATVSPSNVVVRLKLNNGVTPSGTIKTVSVNLGGSSQKINVTEYTNPTDLDANRTQVNNIADALEPVLAKPVVGVEEIITSTVLVS